MCINSMNNSNKFNFTSSGIIKVFILKNYQIKIKFSKSSSTILNILMFKAKLTCQLIKQADEKKVDALNSILGSNVLFTIITLLFNLISHIANSSVHLMFPGSLWTKNDLYVCASAPISLSGTATLQGTHSHFYPLCTRECYVYKFVMHTPGTSSVTVQTETSLKIHFSISGTLIDHGRQLINLDSIFVSTYFKVSKNFKRIKSVSFQKVDGGKVFGFLLNLHYLLGLKLVWIRPLCLNTSNKKLNLGNFKINLTISYSLIIFITNTFVFYLQKNLFYLNTLLPINALIIHIELSTHHYQ